MATTPGQIKKSTETDAEVLARNIPPKRPCKRPLDPSCKDMHEEGFCICLSVACVFCKRQHAPHKPCPKEK